MPWKLSRPSARRARSFAVAGALCAAGAALACSTSTFVVQGYKGPERPAEALSILRINGADGVQLLEVDAEPAGVPLSADARLHIELLPGEHEIVLLNRSQNPPFAEPVGFVAERGRVYRPGFAALGAAGGPPEARVYEVDAASDAVRRDVTRRVANAPAAEPAPQPFTPAAVHAPGSPVTPGPQPTSAPPAPPAAY